MGAWTSFHHVPTVAQNGQTALFIYLLIHVTLCTVYYDNALVIERSFNVSNTTLAIWYFTQNY